MKRDIVARIPEFLCLSCHEYFIACEENEYDEEFCSTKCSFAYHVGRP